VATKTKVHDENWLLQSNGQYAYCHYLTYDNHKDLDDAFKRHLVLEFLCRLKVVEYERGYDGHYYDIWIRSIV
jgi:hypothetical protein